MGLVTLVIHQDNYQLVSLEPLMAQSCFRHVIVDICQLGHILMTPDCTHAIPLTSSFNETLVSLGRVKWKGKT